MLYNERITTDASAGAKVYEGNQGQAIMKQGQEWKQQAARELEQAKDLERKGYKLGLAKGMNELWADEKLSSNPQALAAEMDKMAESVTANIADKDTKVDVLTDFELKKDSYINQATTKMKRIQEEKARSAAFDAIYANIDSLGMSFGNGVSGNFTDGDVVNYQYSLDRIKANINAKAPDGTYLFTDAQRRAMARDADQAIRQGFINTYAELPEAEQKRITKELNDGTYTVANFGLKDLTGDSAYNDIKRDVTRFNNALARHKKEQLKVDADEAIDQFTRNPNDANLAKIEELLPNLPKKYRKELQEMIDEDIDYTSITNYTTKKDLDNALSAFSLKEYDNYEDAAGKAIEMITNARKSNKNKNLSAEDVENFSNSVLKIMQDENIKRGYQELSTYKSGFWDKVAEEAFQFSPFLGQTKMERRRASKYIENLGLEGSTLSNQYLLQGDTKKAIEALQLYRQKIVFAAHPEFVGKKKGDRVVKDGLVYEVTSEETLKPIGR